MEKKVIKLKESDLVRIVKRVISEQQYDINRPMSATTTTKVNPSIEKLKSCQRKYGMYQEGGEVCNRMFRDMEKGIFPKDELILACSVELLQQQQGIRSDGKDETGFICCITDVARSMPRYQISK